MLMILSQKIDSKSSYSDELFTTYHYPARYRNQLHSGDTFVYYQGNRFEKEQRYYFGCGIIGDIHTSDEENYYAELIHCQRFKKKVPIYLPDGGYIEQLGYQDIRKSVNPPWQSSIRPLSKTAYDYILKHAGVLTSLDDSHSIEELKVKLKSSIRAFYLENDSHAILGIESNAAEIANALCMSRNESSHHGNTAQARHESLICLADSIKHLQEYCVNMKMTYSYKPLLIMALLQSDAGGISIAEAASYFRRYYNDRREQGLTDEKKKNIYQNPNVTDTQIVTNLISNPVKALVASGYFVYDAKAQILSVLPDIWVKTSSKDRSIICDICRQRLEQYYS